MSRVFLDTRDLINIVERGNPLSVSDLRVRLQEAGCTLVVALTHIRELAEPLVDPARRPSTPSELSTFKTLEGLPLEYVDEETIPCLELDEVVSASRSGREVRQVQPFVDRLEAIVPPAVGWRGSSLSEMVWAILQANPRAFLKPPHWQMGLEKAVTAGRRTVAGARSSYDNTWHHLLTAAQRCGRSLEGIQPTEFSRWVEQSRDRCPGISLWGAVQEQVLLNRDDQPTDNDIADQTWLWLLPYVDVATLDGRMVDYVARACRGRTEQRCALVSKTVAKLLAELQ